MRHKKAGKKLGRNSSHRKAMLRNMVTSLFKYEQIETTDAKAKTIRPIAEKMITLAKRGDLHARRQALAYIKDKAVTHRLFEGIKDRYLDRQGGYLRIIKKGTRKGDGAPMSIIQLLSPDEVKESGKRRTNKKKAVQEETSQHNIASNVDQEDNKVEGSTADSFSDPKGAKEKNIESDSGDDINRK